MGASIVSFQKGMREFIPLQKEYSRKDSFFNLVMQSLDINPTI